MKKPQIVFEDRSTVRIQVAGQLDTAEFEDVLARGYKRTMGLLSTKTIVFNFSGLTWCEVWPLSLLAMWIHELVALNGKVIVEYPMKGDTREFLSKYGLTQLLNRLGVEVIDISGDSSDRLPNDLLRAPFFPLTFFSEQDFKNLLAELQDQDHFRLLFADIEDNDLIKTGAIRDVIIWELGDNLYRYAEGRFGNIVMTKIGSSLSISRDQLKRRMVPSVRHFERSFLRHIGTGGYISIVISDKGPGIRRTLQKSYSEHIGHGKSTTSQGGECDVIEYSFDCFSTSRSTDERIGAIRDAISDQHSNRFKPETGLFRLFQTVRDAHGLLLARSGRSLVAYNFYLDPRQPKTFRSCDHESDLASFGGTQFKILLPVRRPINETSIRSRIAVNKSPKEHPTRYYFLSASFENIGVDDLQRQAEALQNFLYHVQKERLTALKSDPVHILVANLSRCNHLAPKVIPYVLTRLGESAPSKEITVFVDVPSNVLENTRINFDQFVTENKNPIPVFDEYGVPHLIGASSEVESMFTNLYKNPDYKPGEDETAARELVRKYPNLFQYDFNSSRLQVHDGISIAQSYKRPLLKAALKEMLESPQIGVFDAHARVLLPSEVYCEGYFDLTRIQDNSRYRALVLDWINTWISELEPTILVSIGRRLGHILDEISGPLKRIKIATGKRPLIRIKDVPDIPPNATLLIVVDVIGTGATLEQLIPLLAESVVVNIICLINARPGGLSESGSYARFLRDSVVQRALHYFYHLPRNWLYTDVHQVDPYTHALVRPQYSSARFLWKGLTQSISTVGGREVSYTINSFLDDVVLPSASALSGHFTLRDSRHLTYIFNPTILTERFAFEMCEVIRGDVNLLLAKVIGRDITVSHIAFPAFNAGTECVAKRLAAIFRTSKLHAIDMAVLRSQFPSASRQIEGVDAVILIDSVFESGATLISMLDYLEQRGAQYIFAYPIICRANESTVRRYVNLTRYNCTEVHIQFLASVEIPTFPQHDCPVCASLAEWERVREEFLSITSVQSLAEKEIARLSPKSVENITNEQLHLPFGALSSDRELDIEIRWRLQLSLRYPGERHWLDRLVREYSSNDKRRRILSLFSIIDHERFFQRLDEPMRALVFHDEFRRHIIEASKYFLENPKELDVEHLESVLSVMNQVDPEALLSRYTKVLQACIDDCERLLRVVSFGVREKKFFDYPRRICEALKRVDQQVLGNDELKHLLAEFIHFWRRQVTKTEKQARSAIHCYRELTGALFHELGHEKDDLLTMLQSDPLGAMPVKRAWDRLESELLYEVFPLLRAFLRANLPCELTDDLSRLLELLVFQVEHGGETMRKLLWTEESPRSDGLMVAPVQHRDVARELGAVVSRVYELIFAEGGVRPILFELRQNIKRIISEVIGQYEGKFTQKEISVDRVFPEEACLVFGYEGSLKTIIHNIVENVCTHSRAQRFEIRCKIDGGAEAIEIRFLDNGGLRTPLRSGTGLSTSMNLATRYCGELSVKNVRRNSPDYMRGFRTVASLKLASLAEDVNT